MNEESSANDANSERITRDNVREKMNQSISRRPTSPPTPIANRLKAKLNRMLLEKQGKCTSEEHNDSDSELSDDAE